MSYKIVTARRAAALAGLLSLCFAPMCFAAGCEHSASAVILINATPKTVWRAVHEERFHDPDIAYARILSQEGDCTTLEEKFQAIPIIGSVVAILEQHEQPYKRIDYALVKSDKFKNLTGSWALTPINGGKQTLLKLSSYLDIGVPFSAVFVRSTTQHKLDRRLNNVKHLAEKEQSHLAASGTVEL